MIFTLNLMQGGAMTTTYCYCVCITITTIFHPFIQTGINNDERIVSLCNYKRMRNDDTRPILFGGYFTVKILYEKQ